MSDILCVTNRALCRENFLRRIEKIAEARPRGIILREKDLSEEEYRNLAVDVLEICRFKNVLCILHSFPKTAMELECSALHLPLPQLCSLSAKERAFFSILGASCHSTEDAVMAEKLGCTYITAGHVFDTDCKKGLPGRGLDFLKDVCTAVSIPVYAIGGICAENYAEVRKAGASGGCVMSGAMVCENIQEYLAAFSAE